MNRKIRCACASHADRCAHCRRLFLSDPRVKDQHFCGRKACQRARKALWQRQKMANDPDYRANQRDCQTSWQKEHPDYWCKYRSRRRDYCERNRLLQKHRDSKKHRLHDLAKMDASGSFSFVKPGTYYLIPEVGQSLAKMDALSQKFHLIPVT
jgi:hypothetical protein